MIGLLDYLSEEVNCGYLSDLKNTCYHVQIVSLLKELEIERFTLSQWQETVKYIFNYNQPFESVQEIKDYIAKQSHV